MRLCAVDPRAPLRSPAPPRQLSRSGAWQWVGLTPLRTCARTHIHGLPLATWRQECFIGYDMSYGLFSIANGFGYMYFAWVVLR